MRARMNFRTFKFCWIDLVFSFIFVPTGRRSRSWIFSRGNSRKEFDAQPHSGGSAPGSQVRCMHGMLCPITHFCVISALSCYAWSSHHPRPECAQTSSRSHGRDYGACATCEEEIPTQPAGLASIPHWFVATTDCTGACFLASRSGITSL